MDEELKNELRQIKDTAEKMRTRLDTLSNDMALNFGKLNANLNKFITDSEKKIIDEIKKK